jgi:hypothetical protein
VQKNKNIFELGKYIPFEETQFHFTNEETEIFRSCAHADHHKPGKQ